MSIRLSLVAVLIGLLGTPAMASWQIGGGPVIVSFEDDLSDVDTGIGGLFSGAYQHSDHFAFDFSVGGSIHEEDRGNEDAFYSFILIGGKLTFGEGNTRPYLAFGISLNYIDFDEFQEISGEGLYFGLGADFLIKESHSVNVSYRVNDWDGEDDEFDYDIETGYLFGAYNFRFK